MISDHEHNGFEPDEELVRRLREMERPQLSAEMRARYWEDFKRRLNGEEPEPVKAEAEEAPRGLRSGFTRRLVPASLTPVVSGRVDAARAAPLRPAAARVTRPIAPRANLAA